MRKIISAFAALVFSVFLLGAPGLASAADSPRGSLDKPKVLTLAKKTGLDVAALENEIKGKKSQTEKVFQENYKLAQELNITGTPGFVIGDMVIRGAINFEALKMVVAQNRKMQKEN